MNPPMTRYQVIQALVDARKYESFLEIGTYRGDTFRNVSCPIKVSVDPDPESRPTYLMDSDTFFRTCRDTFDIVFIDGLHEHAQAWRDINNALSHLNPDGAVVLHDCLPTTEKMQEWCDHSRQGEIWTGDVWKAYYKALSELPYLVYVLDTDYGCGIIDTAWAVKPSGKEVDMSSLSWNDYLELQYSGSFNTVHVGGPLLDMPER